MKKAPAKANRVTRHKKASPKRPAQRRSKSLFRQAGDIRVRSLWKTVSVALFVIVFAFVGVRLLTGGHAAAAYTNIYSGFAGKCLDDYQQKAVDGNPVD